MATKTLESDSMTLEYGISFQDGMRGDYNVRNVKEFTASVRADKITCTFITDAGEVKTIEKNFSELTQLNLRK